MFDIDAFCDGLEDLRQRSAAPELNPACLTLSDAEIVLHPA